MIQLLIPATPAPIVPRDMKLSRILICQRTSVVVSYLFKNYLDYSVTAAFSNKKYGLYYRVHGCSDLLANFACPS